MKTKNYSWLLLLFSVPAWGAGEIAPSFTLDGTLYDSPGGTQTLLDATAVVRVQIWNPAKTCVLYDEQQTVDTTLSDGAFTIQVGSHTGAGKRVGGSDPGNTMVTVFQNLAAIAGSGGGCAGATYTPAARDVRYLRVIVTPSSTGTPDTLSPDMTVTAVPNSMVAESLQGVGRTGFLQLATVTNLTQSNLESVFSNTNYPILAAMLTASGATVGGTNAGNYEINADSDGNASGAINFNIGGSTKASITNGGNFVVDTNTLFVDAANNRVSIGTAAPSYDLSFGGEASRTLAMERRTTADTAGNQLTVAAGGATTGATDRSGGDLYLASGTATGTGSSNIYLQTATAGAAGVADRAPSTKMTILGSGNVGLGTATPGSGTKLNVVGQIRTPSTSIATAAVDWSGGNVVTTSYNCAGNISFANMRDGGSYTLVVTDVGTTQCGFDTATTGDDNNTVTYRFRPANAVRTATSHTVYSLMRVGTVVYVSWITGF